MWIGCHNSAKGTIHMKCQPIFYEKFKKDAEEEESRLLHSACRLKSKHKFSAPNLYLNTSVHVFTSFYFVWKLLDKR